MGRKYNNPPLIEALCEFQFIPTEPYDSTIPGLFYTQIKGDFPEKQEQSGIGFTVQGSDTGIEQKITRIPSRVQFLNKDKTKLVQLAPDLLVINCLKPYPSWEEFKPIIVKNMDIYREIAKPKGFRRIGLRYINVFEFDSLNIELKDYFCYYPLVPQGFPNQLDAFLCRTELPYQEERLILTLATIMPENPNQLSITLDLDYVMNIPERIYFNDVSEWLDKAHERVENAFEACITDKLRKKFEEAGNANSSNQ